MFKERAGKWRTMYIDMVEFISTASPQTRSFIAGQLYGLTERLMNETLKENNMMKEEENYCYWKIFQPDYRSAWRLSINKE